MEKMVFLVAIPNGALYHCCEKIQQSIWEKYNLGEGEFPEVHLTMDAFFYEDLDELEKIKISLNEIIPKIGPFEIRSNGFGYIPHPYNCITLHIVKTEELKNAYASIHSYMKGKGFKVREFSPEEVVFHISLAGTHGRKWSEEESLHVWNEMRKFQLQEISLLDKLELWYPELDPKIKVIAKMKLERAE